MEPDRYADRSRRRGHYPIWKGENMRTTTAIAMFAGAVLAPTASALVEAKAWSQINLLTLDARRGSTKLDWSADPRGFADASATWNKIKKHDDTGTSGLDAASVSTGHSGAYASFGGGYIESNAWATGPSGVWIDAYSSGWAYRAITIGGLGTADEIVFTFKYKLGLSLWTDEPKDIAKGVASVYMTGGPDGGSIKEFDKRVNTLREGETGVSVVKDGEKYQFGEVMETATFKYTVPESGTYRFYLYSDSQASVHSAPAAPTAVLLAAGLLASGRRRRA